MAVDLFANAASTTLAAGIGAGATSLTVASSALFSAVTTAAGTQFRVVIDSELFIVTNVTGTTWTITPGAEGTTQAAHASGAPVTAIVTAASLATFAPKATLAWAASTSYVASQLVVYLGALYLRTTSGVSGTTFDVANWTVLTSAQSVAAGSTPPDAPGVTYVVVTASATVPAQVTGLSGTAAGTSVALTWTAPATGGSAITDYLVEFRTGAAAFAAFTHAASAATSQTVTGLTVSTSYDFRVSAVNAVGTGAVSAVYTISTTSGATLNSLPLVDTFVRADQTGIGTPSDGKIGYTVVGAINILANAAKGQTAAGNDTALRDTGVSNMKVAVDLIGASATPALNIAVRSDATGQNCYNVNINTAHVVLYKKVAGVYTQIGAANTTVAQTGNPQTFTVNINGSTITVTRDAGTAVFTMTDTSITTGNYGGVRTEDNTTYTYKNLNMSVAT